jgi:transcriptional regulator with XRE-family HTH domain
MSYSLFATSLAQVLSLVFHDKQDKLAADLGVHSETIDLWLREDAIPKPETLYRLYRLCQHFVARAHDRLADRAFGEFKTMLGLSSQRVTPHYRSAQPSLGIYMLRPTLDTLNATFTRLGNIEEAEKWLESAAKQVQGLAK